MKKNYKYIYNLHMLFNLLILIHVTFIILNYNILNSEYVCQLVFYKTIYSFVIDRGNIAFITLISIIYPLCTIYNYNSMKFGFRLNSFVLLISEVILLLAFMTNNLLIFYILFESLLIPMALLIGFFGSRARRIYAVYLFLFFTLLSSFFVMLGIAVIYDRCNTLCFINIMEYTFTTYDKNLILFLFFIGFISKIPMVPLHLWLPEAHVEASTIGSVILAAVVLKLGFYGIYRIFEVVCFFDLPIIFKKVFIVFSINSIMYASFLVVRQVDLKKIVAYSSIIHMNSGMLGLCGTSIIGNVGSIFVMFSHGLISAGMFFLIGMLYDRFHVRNYMYYGGLIQYMPIFGIFMFIIFLGNMSLPGTCNFVGEFLVFISIYKNFNLGILLIVLSLTFFTTLFCMIVINKILFYQITGFLNANLRDVDKNEFYILFVLSFFIILFGLLPNLIINLL